MHDTIRLQHDDPCSKLEAVLGLSASAVEHSHLCCLLARPQTELIGGKGRTHKTTKQGCPSIATPL